MENRDRDKVSQNTRPTEAGEVNRKTSEREGMESDSSAEFGQKIGRSAELNSPERERESERPSAVGMEEGQSRPDRSGRSETDH